MKKYFWTLSVMALFAIGFAASDDDDSSNSSSSSSSQTEQKQETEAERQERERQEEAERQAREQKEKESQQEKKKKEVAEVGYKKGYEDGFSYTSKHLNAEKIIYNVRYGAPTNSEEMELFRIFKENYDKGFDEGHKVR